jgi:hypothetical protein
MAVKSFKVEKIASSSLVERNKGLGFMAMDERAYCF